MKAQHFLEVFISTYACFVAERIMSTTTKKYEINIKIHEISFYLLFPLSYCPHI